MKLSRSGFTIVEILITLVVMAILLALGTYAVGTMIAQARDKERESDVTILANGLEARYNNGNSHLVASQQQTQGYYPGYNEFVYSAPGGWDWCASKSAIYTPCNSTASNGMASTMVVGVTSDALIGPTGQAIASLWGVAAASVSATITTLTSQDKYVYEANDASGNPCYDEGCVKFNIYYRREIDNTIVKVTSKRS